MQNQKPRQTWHEYFMSIAQTVSTRATCDRKHVGAVIVKDRIILSTGYNGSIIGQPHCDDIGHDMENGHCVRTVHAEANAIAQAARTGQKIEGASIYITTLPCWPCYKLIRNSGIEFVYYRDAYRPDPRISEGSGLHRVPEPISEGST